MKMKTGVCQLRMALLGLSAAAMLACAPAYAQLSTSTIKGQITQAGAPAQAATQIVAVNRATGFTYRTTTAADGSYVLSGLAPGVYQIQVGAEKSEAVTLAIGETASIDLAVGAAGTAATPGVQRVVVQGSLQRKDVKTSEVGTSVSRAQIENTPQVTRNFLAFADLAPGVRFDVDPASGYGKLQSGAQNQDNVNVFIDGVGQKNYILRGGLSGLDSSRGNPFPQSAVAEYKVISQNYKAEFDQVSSAAITAITKSGTNQFHGEAFYDRTGSSMTAYDPFQKKNRAAGVDRPSYKQSQYGFSLGGPIKQDAMHFFAAYEAKDIDSPRQVVAQRTDLLPNAGIVPSLLAQAGPAVSKFKEHLFLGKVDAQLSEDQRLEVSTRIRRESDLVPEDNKLSVPGNEKDRRNDETRFDVKHEWTYGDFLNEARVGFEEFSWNPHAKLSTPFIKYVVSFDPANNPNNVTDVLFTGGSPDSRDKRQKGYSIADDLTWTGMSNHAFKTGIKVKRVDFDMSGTSRGVDIVRAMINRQTGQPTTIQTDLALAPIGINYGDTQYGLYLQDDWKVNQKLELNLGMRWDYETNMLNDSYVTPADRLAVFGQQDPRAGAPVGQTYAQSLAKGGVVIGDFVSNGSNRKAYKKAFQPRLGFSYDVNGDRNTVVFGGMGRAYDRSIADLALDEKQKNAQPNGEIWMIRSDHKMPYTDQFSLGLRQGVSVWNTEIGYTYSRSHNQFNWFGGNRDVNGGYGGKPPSDFLDQSVPPFGTLVLGDFITQVRTQTLYGKGDKPYSVASGWGLAATYTYSQGETSHNEWTNNLFNWNYGRFPLTFHPSTDVERHRLVVSGLTDRLLPYGIMLSSKVTLGSGLPYRITNCSAGFSTCFTQKGQGGSFREVDLAVSKDIAVGFGKVGLRMDVLNLFNTINYAGYDSWVGGPGNPQNYLGGDNSHLGVPGSVGGPMRTLKFSARYSF